MSVLNANKPLFTRDIILWILSHPTSQTYGKNNTYLIYRLLQGMMQRQTADEVAQQGARYQNEVGFNKFDAPFLTSVARNSVRYNNLTVNQARAVGKALAKYINQLCEISGCSARPTDKIQQPELFPKPAVVPEPNPNEAPKIVRHALGDWHYNPSQCPHTVDAREGFLCIACGAVFDKPVRK